MRSRATAPQAYPAYKPSGVQWLGDVPKHWEVRRLKQVCSRHSLYAANVAASGYEDEGVRVLRTTDISEDCHLLERGVLLPREVVAEYLLGDGDILLSRSGTVGRSFLYSSDLHGECTYAGNVGRFIPNSDVISRSLFFFTNAGVVGAFLRLMAISSTIDKVNADMYANGHLPVPPSLEQHAIGRYLDWVDRRIRRYVRAKGKRIGLLEEEKQAVINQAVTRGLDPTVRRMPSGVEWLGDVPEHWQVRTLGRIANSFRTGPFGSVLHQTDYVDDGTPVINPTHMRNGSIVEDSSCSVPESVAASLSDYRLETHDLVFSRRGELGPCALVRSREAGWICGTGSIRIRVDYSDVDPEFLIQAFHVPWVAEYLSLASVGATMDNLNTGILKGMPVVLPPIREQRRLLQHIAQHNRESDIAIARARRQIELIEEYRRRLIADVVTGKLDVRKAAAELPDGPEADGEAEDVAGEFAHSNAD